MSNKMSKEIAKQIDEFIYEYQQEGMLPSIAKERIKNLLDQQTKPLIDEIEKLQSHIDELEKANEKHIESLNYVRNSPKTWKSGGIGGQDQYAGMPPMLRYIDEIIDNLTTLKQTNNI